MALGERIPNEAVRLLDGNVSDDGYKAVDDDDDAKGDSGGQQSVPEESSYMKLMETNRPFRLYLSSYLVTHMGEWLNYIASITMIEDILEGSSASSRTSISILVMLRLVPNVILSPFGGTLADSRDRRESMIALDVIGALVAFLYIIAYQAKSISLLYFLTCTQECVAALYEPCRTSIITLLVQNEEDLKKATTLAGLAWSFMQAVGSALGGLIVSVLGIRVCFVVDGCSYLVSAFLMWQVGGSWRVANDNHESPWAQIKGMTVDGVRYLWSSFFGALVLLKASGAFVYGAADVLNVSYSERDSHGDSSARLGVLFAVAGAGCLVGPLIADRLTNMKRPASLQLVCIYSIWFIVVGYVGMGMFYPFWTTCLFSGIRAAGSSALWIDSDLLLQKFSAPEMLGRVLAVDYGLATLTEAASAWICGILQDKFGLSPERVSFVMTGIGMVMLLLWVVYHSNGGGAAAYEDEDDSDDEEIEKDSLTSETSSLRSDAEVVSDRDSIETERPNASDSDVSSLSLSIPTGF